MVPAATALGVTVKFGMTATFLVTAGIWVTAEPRLRVTTPAGLRAVLAVATAARVPVAAGRLPGRGVTAIDSAGADTPAGTTTTNRPPGVVHRRAASVVRIRVTVVAAAVGVAIH
jgi:hypothetical protein